AFVLDSYLLRIDKKFHSQIAPDRTFTFGFSQAAHPIKVVGLDPIEIVFSLRIDHSEDRVGVSLAMNVRNAPVVARDGDVARLCLPAHLIRDLTKSGERNKQQRECERENKFLHQETSSRIRLHNKQQNGFVG